MMTEQILKLTITYRKKSFGSSVQSQVKLFFESYNENNNHLCEVNVSDPYNIDYDGVYKAEVYEIDVVLNYKNCEKLCEEIFLDIVEEWCKPKQPLCHTWLRLANRSVLKNLGKSCHTDLDVNEFAFGTLPSMQDFMQHYHYKSILRNDKSNDKEIISSFFHSQRFFVLYTSLKHIPNCRDRNKCHKFRVDYKSISRVLINIAQLKEKVVEIFFILKHIPFVYVEKENEVKKKDKTFKEDSKEKLEETLVSDQEYQEKKWERSLTFGCPCIRSRCEIGEIGCCPVFKIVISHLHRANGVIKRLIQRCADNVLFLFTSIKTDIRMKHLPDYEYFFCKNDRLNSLADKQLFSDITFESQYAWEVVNGMSQEVKDQLILNCMNSNGTNQWTEIKEKLKSSAIMNITALTSTLFHISDLITRNEIFSFCEAFEKLFRHYNQSPSKLDLPDGMCLVRRVIITPSRTICLQPTEHFDNRVIRQFKSEYMLRVSIQDDNFQKLTYALQSCTKKDEFMRKVVCSLLIRSIQIGLRQYEILAASNSQLREHGIWMHARDHDGNTAASIRKWMGDFSHIKNVAKYMARMGQCFSSSEESVQILLKDEDVLKVEDIKTEDGMYTFSDGIGMISSELAAEIRKAISDNLPLRVDNISEPLYEPSAFQIRFKGCKGMVAVNPTLKSHKLVIRASMEKFPCVSSNYLEIVKISAPRNLFLNRPFITILEQHKVEPNVFLRLQTEMVLDLTDSLIYEKKAHMMLSSLTNLNYPYKRLLKAGVCLTQEPFFRSLLLSVYKVAINMLRSKARIAIPPDFGRNMLGVLDETFTLEYGQVFLQISKNIGNSESPTRILEGTVVVTKNPCMHPGDVRKLEAVKVPEGHPLRSHKDVIVFPAKGRRPHPDEMAGSDLDGDEYVVLWLKDLVFPQDNYPPMLYPANRETVHSGSIDVEDMMNFMCSYIQNDNIGSLAYAHLARADYDEEGIFSPVCMSIAQKYPKVLDFAKSGTTTYLTANERPKLYPDFMEKGASNNSYKSKRVLGLLYRISRNLEACVSKIDALSPSVEVDPCLIYPGWQNYEVSAKYYRKEYSKRIKNILKKYGMQCEAEVLTGFVSKVTEYSQNRQERENALNIAKTYMLDAMKRAHMEFIDAFDKECRQYKLTKEKIRDAKYARASAWYMVTYQDEGDQSIRSFPWVLHQYLCDIREINTKNLKLPPISANRSSFIDISDQRLLTDLKRSLGILGKRCYCVVALYRAVEELVTKSSLIVNTTNVGAAAISEAPAPSCVSCIKRIIEYFLQEKCRKEGTDSIKNSYCCSFDKTCECRESCSPTKLILELLKFYSTEVVAHIGACTNDTHCNGFRFHYLQSLALKAFASLAITRDAHHAPNEACTINLEDDNDAEGDPIRVSVSKEFEDMFVHHNDAFHEELKLLSGVKFVFIRPGKDHRGHWYVLVHSIGKGWNRWNLEELMMDEDIVTLIQSRIDSKPSTS